MTQVDACALRQQVVDLAKLCCRLQQGRRAPRRIQAHIAQADVLKHIMLFARTMMRSLRGVELCLRIDLSLRETKR